MQFVKFANINEDTPSYHRRYDFFISKFSSMCHSDAASMRDSLRLAGIKGLQGVIRKTVSDDLVENIWEAEHMEKIVPSLLFNMQVCILRVLSLVQPFGDGYSHPSQLPVLLANYCTNFDVFCISFSCILLMQTKPKPTTTQPTHNNNQTVLCKRYVREEKFTGGNDQIELFHYITILVNSD